MKKCLLFPVLCLVALNQCDIWNKPLAEPLHIRTIVVTMYPNITEFAPEEIPAESWEWAELGLEISGINNIDVARVLGPEEYSIELPNDSDFEAGEVQITVKYNNADVRTDFTIKALYGGYEIDWFRDDHNNFVYTEPRIISEKDFDAGGGVYVDVKIIPAERYEYIDGSLAYSQSDTPPPPRRKSIGVN
jgi:hypothetical protein